MSLTRHLRVRSLTLALAVLASASSAAHAQAAQPPRAVLVTGASSGIGRKVTEYLASHGYFVYAGARAPADLDALNKIANVQSIRLDVTSASDIAAAVAIITNAKRGLYGVVNNAGVLVVAPLIELEDKDLDYILGVNLYGPFRITKAFAPLIIESRGRVVNISSLNGIVASPMLGAYSMSKHAVEAYGDGLSAELARFGVKVALIEPGNYGTEIGRNFIARIDTSIVKGSRFEAQMRNTINSMRQFENNPPPDSVATAVYDAFTNATPKMRYLVTPIASQANIAIRKVVEELVQLNDAHPYSLDRDALVKLLDDALARSKAAKKP